MKSDCAYMAKQISNLKKQIKEAMIRKFGTVVDLNEVEESYLRRLVLDLRLSSVDFQSMYQAEIELYDVRFTISPYLIHLCRI